MQASPLPPPQTLDLSENYDPHPGQANVHDARQWADIIVMQSGRRFGKTRLGFGDLIDTYSDAMLEERPPSLIPPFHCWIVVPNLQSSRQIWHELHGLFPKAAVEEWVESKHMVWLKGCPSWQNRPGLIEIKSAYEPESLQTAGLDYLWFSESQDIENAAFEKGWGTLVSAGRFGRVFAEGIPAMYADHWFQKLFAAAMRPDAADKKMFGYHATSFDNPFLSEEDLTRIEEARDYLSAASWERNYLAKFSTNAGFFRNVDECVAGDLWSVPVPERNYVGGLDIGRVNDPTVLHVMDADARKLVLHREWDGGYPWVTIREALVGIHDQWGLSRLVMDASGMGGKMAEEDLMQTTLPLEPVSITGDNRREMLERLAGAIERVTITFPPVPALLRQLRMMSTRRTSGGNYRVDVPAGEHDDEIFALALALGACNEPRPVQRGYSKRTSGRYVPTTEEANSGGLRRRGLGAQLMRRRKDEGMRQRAIQAGIEVE